ncbi:MAG: hypothetical protein RLZZ353_1511 [Actinomycetota bacterium]
MRWRSPARLGSSTVQEPHQVVGGQRRVVDDGDGGVDQLAEVVRRDVRRHPDGDAGRAVREQVREPCRQDDRLLLVAVVVRDEVDGLLVEVAQQLHREARQPRLGVAHRGRRVAVDRAEVAVAVDQRVPDREVLPHPDQRVVDRAVTVGVVLLHDVADGRRALAVRAVGAQARLVHRVQDAAVDRLQAVSDVGQGPADDDRHRVVEVRGLHLVLDDDGLDRSRRHRGARGGGCVGPGALGRVGRVRAVDRLLVAHRRLRRRSWRCARWPG